MKTLNLLCFQ